MTARQIVHNSNKRELTLDIKIKTKEMLIFISKELQTTHLQLTWDKILPLQY